MAETKPEFLVILGYYTEAGLMVKQMAEMQIKVPVYAGSSVGIAQYRDIAGPAADGTYGALYYLAGSIDTPRGRSFVDAWKAKYNRMPTQYEGMGYDAVYVLADAIKRASAKGKLTPKAIRDAIFETKDFAGATGPITILPNGDAQRPLPMAQLVGNEIKLDALLQ